jgi:hypothetical protein
MTPDDRLIELLEAMCEETLSTAEAGELESRVTGSPQAMDIYLQYAQLHGQLHWDNAAPAECPAIQYQPEAQASDLSNDSLAVASGLYSQVEGSRAVAGLPTEPRTSTAGFRWWARLIEAANQQPVAAALFALVLLSVIVLTAALLRTPEPQLAAPPLREVDPSEAPGTVAQVIATHECVWGEMDRQVGERSYLLAGQVVNVERGLVEIEFKPGTRVILQGPAEFAVDSTGSVRLDRGRLAAKVPPAGVGFAVATPTAEIVDLGTRFGVRVNAKGDSTVRVFVGEVETTATATEEVWRLVAGQSARFTSESAAVIAASEEETFVTEMPAPPPPELIGFYPLDGDARDASGNGNHATAVKGIQFVAGREGQAAQFAGATGSYIDLPINASQAALPRMTWGAWVRPAVVDGVHREILSTDNGGFDRVLTIDDRLGSALTGQGPRFAAFCGQHGVVPSRSAPASGEWTFVAAVYDGPANRMALYVGNSKTDKLTARTASTAIGPSLPFIRVGMHAGGVEEPFVGEIDNVFVFRGVLGLEEIKVMHMEGGEGARQFGASPNEVDATNVDR